MLLVASVVFAVLPWRAEAAFNKCVINGVVTYQNGPCPSSEVRGNQGGRDSLLQDLNNEEKRRRAAGGNKLFPTSKSFTCDGRQYCSQMSSCAEAKYFLANCPGVKMDGDKNGIPCEQQWCGH